MNRLTLFSLILIAGLVGCSRNYAQKDYEQNRYLMLGLLEPNQTDAQASCQAMVWKMNECAAPGFGVDVYATCESKAVTATKADYDAAITCVAKVVADTGCNLPQYKVQTSAATVALFTTCQTSTGGITLFK